MASPDDFGYQSSEEFQRHKKTDVFSTGQKEKKVDLAEKEKVKKVLDKYIAVHSSTKAVRDLAKAQERGAEYQLDLSADIVEILEKIKSDLR